MKDTAFFTICSANYLHKAFSLARSIRRCAPDSHIAIYIVDSKRDIPNFWEGCCSVVWVEDLCIEEYPAMKTYYDIIELNTAVKPRIALSLVHASFQYVYFYDPDTYVYNIAPAGLLFPHETCVCLTPHCLSPYLDDSRPSELDLLKYGTYNLGFIGFKNDPRSIKLLEWWWSKLKDKCIYEPFMGMAVDQKWLDLAPLFFEGVNICRLPGLNVAFWNIHERTISYDPKGGHFCNNEPLYFYHFSSFDDDNPRIVAKKQTRFLPNSRSDLVDLYSAYQAEIKEASSHLSGVDRGYGATKREQDAYPDTFLSLLQYHKAKRRLSHSRNNSITQGMLRKILKPLFRNDLATEGSIYLPISPSSRRSIRQISVIIAFPLFITYLLLGHRRYLNLIKAVQFLFTPYINAAIISNLCILDQPTRR